MTSQVKDVFGEHSLPLYLNLFLFLLLTDFVIGRLLQRVYSPFATVGIVVATFANLLEFVILISVAYISYTAKRSFLTKLTSATIFLAIFLAAAILYLTFNGASPPPEISLFFKIASLLIIALAIFQRMNSTNFERGPRFLSYVTFFTLLLSYVLAYYYQIAVTLSSNYLLVAPFYVEAFQIGEYLLLVTFFFFFVYSLSVPCKNFKMNRRTFSKTALIPTLIIGPLLLGTIFYFRLTQYLAMLMVEILGFVFSRVEVIFFILSVWFLFTGILVLKEKSRLSEASYLSRESMAFATMFLGGFIFGFVYYFFIGVVGALLLSVPLKRA